ncbi:MAG: hypothetical protein ACKO4Q_12855, partial [Planctomycetota bacterium]
GAATFERPARLPFRESRRPRCFAARALLAPPSALISRAALIFRAAMRFFVNGVQKDPSARERFEAAHA